jgi:hypothetical protein
MQSRPGRPLILSLVNKGRDKFTASFHDGLRSSIEVPVGLGIVGCTKRITANPMITATSTRTRTLSSDTE